MYLQKRDVNLAQVIVQSTDAPATITLTTAAAGLKSGSLTITTR